MLKISYVIGVHNEASHYIEKLLDQIIKLKDKEDEVIVVDDYSTNQDTVDSLSKYKDQISVVQHALNGDFAEHKNFMNSLAKGDWIFNIDADECPHQNLLLTLKEIIVNNPSIEMYYVPRMNIIPDLKPEYVQKWGWNLTEGFINYPDYQGRIYKNSPSIKWEGKVHEKLTGSQYHTLLPAFDLIDNKPVPDYCLLHVKDMQRQITQNEFYSKII